MERVWQGSRFFVDMENIANFLRRGYKKAEVPTIKQAEKELSVNLVKLWIKGSAKNLLNHYFYIGTSENVF